MRFVLTEAMGGVAQRVGPSGEIVANPHAGLFFRSPAPEERGQAPLLFARAAPVNQSYYGLEQGRLDFPHRLRHQPRGAPI